MNTGYAKQIVHLYYGISGLWECWESEDNRFVILKHMKENTWTGCIDGQIVYDKGSKLILSAPTARGVAELIDQQYQIELMFDTSKVWAHVPTRTSLSEQTKTQETA
jgi:hypothetical protein